MTGFYHSDALFCNAMILIFTISFNLQNLKVDNLLKVDFQPGIDIIYFNARPKEDIF